MDWVSDRVVKGGIFQPGKVKYSPETKKFLQGNFLILNIKYNLLPQ